MNSRISRHCCQFGWEEYGIDLCFKTFKKQEQRIARTARVEGVVEKVDKGRIVVRGTKPTSPKA